MSVLYSFMDGSEYGADEVNQIFSRLTTQGVSLFKYSNGDNPLMALNDAVSSFTHAGVEMYNLNACEVTYNSESEKFSVGAGSAFMYDGSCITIDTDPYDITDEVLALKKMGAENIWVCFYRNTGKNIIEISVEADDVKLNSEYSVPLAKISSDNSVFDMRKIAVSRVAPCTANVIEEEVISCGRINMGEAGANRLKVTVQNVFPGVSYVYISTNAKLFKIQNIDTETGDELTFERAWNTNISKQNDFVAFNRVGTDLQIWIYTIDNYTLVNEWQLMIF